MGAKTPFQERLESIGDAKASEQLGVKVRTVKAWRLGARKPRPEQAQEIAARWPISLEDIYVAREAPQQQAAWDGHERRGQMG